MRVIKFRGKRVDNAEWIYGYYVKGETRHCILRDLGGMQFDVIPETVGQLLTSEKNPNFFEGDIIADTLPISKETDFKNAYVVTWENYYDISPTEYVIGNIHDNPELLTHEKD